MNPVTLSWLSDNVQRIYSTQPSRVFADVQSLLSRFLTLRPKSDMYTYDDGRTQLLLCIHGLLPISFRNATYNIPISLWIPLEYPAHPPIAYVVPTSDMLVRPGKFLDPSGKSSIPYLEQWSRKSEACNLNDLVDALQQHFSSEPPVYSKPKQPPPPPPSQTGSPHPSIDRPALPPKPPAFSPSSPAAIPPLQQHQLNSPPSTSPIPQTIPSVYTRPPDPSLPHYPPQHTHPSPPQAVSPQWSQSPPPPQQTSLYNPPGHQLPPHPEHIHPQPVTLQQPAYHQSGPINPNPPIAAHQPRVDPPDLLDGDVQPTSAQPPAVAPTPTPLPPRPPNPELLQLHVQVHQKLTSELASLSEAMKADADRLRTQQSSLLAGEPAIRDEMSRLEAVRDVCRTVASRIGSTVEQTERNLTDLRRKGDPEVDELVCSTSIVHNQLINLVAEDNAIEDTVYHLHRALNAGRIDLERFLRTTRVLAEEQFMKRALIEKIQAGLPMGYSVSGA